MIFSGTIKLTVDLRIGTGKEISTIYADLKNLHFIMGFIIKPLWTVTTIPQKSSIMHLKSNV